jgi:hypothetical protein
MRTDLSAGISLIYCKSYPAGTVDYVTRFERHNATQLVHYLTRQKPGFASFRSDEVHR